MDEVTEREAGDLESRLRALAGEWRDRLADPVVAAGVRAGRLRVSPLVRDLLAAFPPASGTSTPGSTGTPPSSGPGGSTRSPAG